MKYLKYFENNNEKLIPDIVKFLKKKFKTEYDTSSNMINNGNCDIFAEELFDILKENEIEGEILSDGLFYNPFDDEPDEMLLDVSEYGNKPINFDEVGLPTHYWFYYNGKHYDSDAPNGVDDMFKLPIIKKFYNKYKFSS